MTERDKIYALPREHVGDFVFDESVAAVFPDMISRSVPGYGSILSVIEQLARRFCRRGADAYDLGCSLGAATLLIARQAPDGVRVHAVDNSTAMIERLAAKLDADRNSSDAAAAAAASRVELHEADLMAMPVRNASMVVLNFTLQFIPQPSRDVVLSKIYRGMLPGGCLVLSEKISFPAEPQQRWMTTLHHDFKAANGYSELEIAQKRTSLENRLTPEPLAAHVARLEAAGFETVVPWFQCFNFASILAIRGDAPE